MALGFFNKKTQETNLTLYRQLTEDGVYLGEALKGHALSGSLLPGYLAQLIDDGFAQQNISSIYLPWSALFKAMDLNDYEGLIDLLELPSFTSKKMSLKSEGSLSDPQFSISVSGWLSDNQPSAFPEVTGAILRFDNSVELMRAEQWRLFREVISFAQRSDTQRDDRSHQTGWGRIRGLALEAEAELDNFLLSCIVLTPDQLDLDIRESELSDTDPLIEIIPSFKNAPVGWLAKFDSSDTVKDKYEMSTADGVVYTIISPELKKVLEVIKSFPGRRAAGSKAKAFLRNPLAVLGPEASAVVNENEIANALELVGYSDDRFFPIVKRDSEQRLVRVGISVEKINQTHGAAAEEIWFDQQALSDFIGKLSAALEKNQPLLAWAGHDLELTGESARYLQELKDYDKDLKESRLVVFYDQLHDLDNYSDRVEGIGIAAPLNSPYISNDGEPWFPETGFPLGTGFPPGTVLPIDHERADELKKLLAEVKISGATTIKTTWLPESITIEEAEGILQGYDQAIDDWGNKPETTPRPDLPPKVARKTLLLSKNIVAIDYEEKRREALLATPPNCEVPSNLSVDCQFYSHQTDGLSWLQHLFKSQSEYRVRGALLADDMGLGKTFQLLAFMAWLVEKNPNIRPMLVVAPVSLLENWRQEVDKFLKPGTLPVLTAYGDALKAMRVRQSEIDARIINEDGLTGFLRRNWIGGAKLVLTNYETLRNFEFAFAAERWSVMVCDEAQKIKNPGTAVTRAAKSQNVDFKIACTGTPVENSLIDLWCLFDFIQPGLLGALNEFGSRYSKPIETRSDDGLKRVEELRSLIAPQILRRTKTEVAKDLPQKIIVDDCKNLELSDEQRRLYLGSIQDFNTSKDENIASIFSNHLGLLQYLRMVCTHPFEYGQSESCDEPINEYKKIAPKLKWLLMQLAIIKNKQEKVLIFCDFRNIQRLLKRYIDQEFSINVDIINGDTSASGDQANSRQKLIAAFQKKPGFGAIILSPSATGFGFNIQGANHVIHYMRPWNPAKEDQATDRAYRIGQTKDVYVYYPTVKADDFTTFDVRLDQLLTQKRDLANDILNGSGDLRSTDFDLSDITPTEGKGDSGFDKSLDLKSLSKLDWAYFEALAAVLWEKQGFETILTPRTGDHGVDVIATRNKAGVLIQAKSSSTDALKLGWNAISEVVAGEAFYRKQIPHCDFEKVGMTNQFFNKNAKEQAKLNNVRLVDQIAIVKLLKKYPTTMKEIHMKLNFSGK